MPSRGRTGGTALLLLAALAPQAYADVPDNWQVGGEHGTVHVLGALTEAACELDMTSARQTVDVGAVPTARLKKTGDSGTPVAFQLRLHNCLRRAGVGGRETDVRTGAVSWSALQPVVSVTFVAETDADTPQLVRIHGADGAGLRLRDRTGRPVYPGSRGTPLFVTPDSDILTWTVAVERTAGTLQPGAWAAVVNFQLSYD